MMKPAPAAGPGKNVKMAMLTIGMLPATVRVIIKLAVVCRINCIVGRVVPPLDKLPCATQGRDAEI